MRALFAVVAIVACHRDRAAAAYDAPAPDSLADAAALLDAPAQVDVDCFGVRNLYPTKAGGQTWCVNMTDPTSDPRFRNLPAMTLQPDGSWQVHGRASNNYQVRMEAWSAPGTPWLNVEITEYAKVVAVGSSGRVLQMYSRGGHHSTNAPCEGSAYKSRLWFDGTATWVKELCHPAYTSNRGEQTVTAAPVIGRWIGHKAVIYNVTDAAGTYVRMESYIDDHAQDADGNLVIANAWRPMTAVEDHGGWTSGSFAAECGAAGSRTGTCSSSPAGPPPRTSPHGAPTTRGGTGSTSACARSNHRRSRYRAVGEELPVCGWHHTGYPRCARW